MRLIDRHRITHLSDFPPVLASLLDAAEKLGSRLPSLQHVSGLDAPPTIQRLHEKTRAQFWTGFGQSETSGFVSIQRVTRQARRRRADRCRSRQVRLVDDYDREVPVGTPGEIVVRGPARVPGLLRPARRDRPHVPQRLAPHRRRGPLRRRGLSLLRQAQAGEGADQARRRERLSGRGRDGHRADGRRDRRAACTASPTSKWGEAIKAVVEVKPAAATPPSR